MTRRQWQKLFPQAQLNFPISRVTTFGVGGVVAAYLPVETPEALMSAVIRAQQAKVKYLVLAGGSNVVFADRRYAGLVIHYYSPQAACLVGNDSLTCNAGAKLSTLVASAVDAGLAGLESLSGIPGTVGGAIVGNAGAYGQAISDHLAWVEVFDSTKQKTKILSVQECRFAYRDSIFKHRPWLVLRANFKLTPGAAADLRRRSQEIIAAREKKYPPGLRCPGSFFKNVRVAEVSKKSLRLIDTSKIIEGKIPAGYLLEAVGAKGRQVGGVLVSDVHGNLIVNVGRARWGEVRRLAEQLRRAVFKRFGIVLEEEVRYLGGVR